MKTIHEDITYLSTNKRVELYQESKEEQVTKLVLAYQFNNQLQGRMIFKDVPEFLIFFDGLKEIMKERFLIE